MDTYILFDEAVHRPKPEYNERLARQYRFVSPRKPNIYALTQTTLKSACCVRVGVCWCVGVLCVVLCAWCCVRGVVCVLCVRVVCVVCCVCVLCVRVGVRVVCAC